MNRSWKLIPIVALAFGLIIPVSAPAAEEKESFFPASIQRDNMDDKIFSTGETAGFNFSAFGQTGGVAPCASTADPNCNFNDAKWGVKTILATPILTLCTANENEDCIESIEISRSGGAFQKLVFEKYVEGGTCDPTAAAGCVFPPDRSKKLLRGGKLAVWSEIVDGKVQEIKYKPHNNKNDDKNIDIKIPSAEYMYYDICCMLFVNQLFVWSDKKYGKRIERINYLSIIFLYPNIDFLYYLLTKLNPEFYSRHMPENTNLVPPSSLYLLLDLPHTFALNKAETDSCPYWRLLSTIIELLYSQR